MTAQDLIKLKILENKFENNQPGDYSEEYQEMLALQQMQNRSRMKNLAMAVIDNLIKYR